jgi:hypothetical protein
VQNVADFYAKKFLVWGGILFIVAAVITVVQASGTLMIMSTAYVLSFIFVGSNFLVIRDIESPNQRKFFWIFGGVFTLRFLSVVGAIILGLNLLNNHQIFFTVSFIISYICHSIIEIIFITQILETDTKN